VNGKLIVLEGLDGSGKATQTALLCSELSSLKVPLRWVSFPDYREPSSALVKMYLSGEFGSDPGDVNAYAASSFYAVDRFASYVRFWRKDYLSGSLIIADRYVTSNMVFQLPKLPRAQWDSFLGWLCEFEYDKLGLPRPDATIYLDMPPEVSQRLLSGRYHGDERKKDIHECNTAFLNACRESAAYCAAKLNWQVINCTDGEQAKSVREIHDEIMKTHLIKECSNLC
jgi:dTMP kinase